jgi:predicted TIM-barrel fold metal-dependent hydrolase
VTLIDADFVAQRAEVAAIAEHLSPDWREHLSTGGGLAGSGYSLPSIPYRTRSSLPSDPAEARARSRELLGRRGVVAAVLDPGTSARLSGIPNAVMAAEIARATNDWLRERWLAEDDRLHGSILVGPRDGELAAREVRRLGGEARMACVVVGHPPVLLGDRSLHPLFGAAAELGLPIRLEAGGAFAGSNPGPAPVGHPTSLFEYRLHSPYGAIAHLISVICEGVFERFPDLRLVLSGFGVAWLPSLLWRLDQEYAAAGAELPRRLRRVPSEIVREHVGFTTWGLERPAHPAALSSLLATVDAQDLLLYASGDCDDDPTGVDALSAAARFGNAQRILRLGPAALTPTSATASSSEESGS